MEDWRVWWMPANMIAEDLPWEGAAKKIPSSRKGVRRLGPHCLGHIAEKIWWRCTNTAKTWAFPADFSPELSLCCTYIYILKYVLFIYLFMFYLFIYLVYIYSFIHLFICLFAWCCACPCGFIHENWQGLTWTWRSLSLGNSLGGTAMCSPCRRSLWWKPPILLFWRARVSRWYLRMSMKFASPASQLTSSCCYLCCFQTSFRLPLRPAGWWCQIFLLRILVLNHEPTWPRCLAWIESSKRNLRENLFCVRWVVTYITTNNIFIYIYT